MPYNRVLQKIFTNARQIDFTFNVHFGEMSSGADAGMHQDQR